MKVDGFLTLSNLNNSPGAFLVIGYPKYRGVWIQDEDNHEGTEKTFTGIHQGYGRLDDATNIWLLLQPH